MNNARAVTICRDLGSGIYTDREKIRAIHYVLYDRLPAAVADAELMRGIAKWLFNRAYIFDI